MRVQLARCWPCQTYPRQCFDPPRPHTWMDDEDAAAAGVPWPMSPADMAKHPCACECAGGPGGCVDR